MLRGEVYEIDFGPGLGREPSGPQPAVVISNDTFNVAPFALVVVPAELPSPLYVPRSIGIRVPAAESGLSADYVFLGFLVRGVDPSRVRSGPLGTLPSARLAEINRILISLLALNTQP